MRYAAITGGLVAVAILNPLIGSIASFALMGWMHWVWRTQAPAEDGGSHREERGLSDA